MREGLPRPSMVCMPCLVEMPSTPLIMRACAVLCLSSRLVKLHSFL